MKYFLISILALLLVSCNNDFDENVKPVKRPQATYKLRSLLGGEIIVDQLDTLYKVGDVIQQGSYRYVVIQKEGSAKHYEPDLYNTTDTIQLGYIKIIPNEEFVRFLTPKGPMDIEGTWAGSVFFPKEGESIDFQPN